MSWSRKKDAWEEAAESLVDKIDQDCLGARQ